MDVDDRSNDRLKRCFIVAPPGHETARIAKAFSDRGVECLLPEKIGHGSDVSEEILKLLASADFVVASLPDETSAKLSFELGVAYALKKPTLVLTTNYDHLLSNLRGLYVVKSAADANHDESSDIDRFLRQAGQVPAMKSRSPSPSAAGAFDWARERAAALKQEHGTNRGLVLERLVADLFEKAGAQFVEAKAETGGGSDLVVWLNDLVYETGGPMIVECKYYTGGSGSVIWNSKHTVEQLEKNFERLEKLVEGSDAPLALLVFSHDRLRPLHRVFETARVLSFAVEQLIDSLENGTFVDDIMQRRSRAASTGGIEVAPN
jgi:hypothetical protein